jgi:aspartate-semialdehyde dehydrogenase
MIKAKRIAIAGATGMVGKTFLTLLEERFFPNAEIDLLASEKSEGKTVTLRGKEHVIQNLTKYDFSNTDLALFSAGASVSAEFAPKAVSQGCVVVDNSSCFRYEESIPLIVPEVNGDQLMNLDLPIIIANPNCSTIQMVQALKPLEDLYKNQGGIKRVDVSTYQATSGAGKAGMKELVQQMQDFFAFKLDESKKEAFAHQIALNVIPQVDVAMPSGFTKEEEKMVYETQKILHKDIAIAATCVRVPVLRSHSESITVTFDDGVDVDVDMCRKVVDDFENVEVIDDLANGLYPMPIMSTDTDITLCGRFRKDIYSNNMLHFFNVADQVRVGAATNAVRIALKWIELED